MIRKVSTLTLLVLFFAACASTPEGRYLQVSLTWQEAVKTWNDSVEADNAQVQACLDSGVEECTPAIPPTIRDKAILIIQEGNSSLDEAATLLQSPDASRVQLDYVLGKIQSLALRLSLQYLSEDRQ